MKQNYGLGQIGVDEIVGNICDGLRQHNVQATRKTQEWSILITRSFYGPEERSELYRGEGFQVVKFASRREAVEAIRELEDGTYYLSHNESGSPKRQPVQVGSRNYKRGLDCWGF